MIKEQQAETKTTNSTATAAAGGVATTTSNSTNAAAMVTNSNLLHNNHHHHHKDEQQQQHSDVDDLDCGMSKLAEINATQPLGKMSKKDSDASAIDHIDSRSLSSLPLPPKINHNMKLEESQETTAAAASAAIMSLNAALPTTSGNDSAPQQQQPAFAQIRAKASPLAKNSRSIRSGGKSATGLKISASSIVTL